MTIPLAGGSALIETLQSSLKQRDGENHQLQWQLSRSQCERNVLMSEVSQLTSEIEGVSKSSQQQTFNRPQITYSNLIKLQYHISFVDQG